MSEPLVSVKMLTYNHAPYIAKAIEGVLMQKTTFPFELVIGEDCSTDGTRDIVFDYARRYPDIIRVVTSEKNVGVKKNSTRVDDILRGKYVAWCEGDDYWNRDDKLQKQASFLEEHGEEYGLVFTDFDCFYETQNTYRYCHLKSSGMDQVKSPTIIDIITKKIDIRTCTVMAIKDLVSKIKNADVYLHRDENFMMGDTQLWAEMSIFSKLYYIQESLSTYRIVKESATQSHDRKKRLAFWVSDSEMYIYLCKKYNIPLLIQNHYEKNWRRGMLELSILEDTPEKAIEVKTKYPSLTQKEFILYLSAKYKFPRFLLKIILQKLKK